MIPKWIQKLIIRKKTNELSRNMKNIMHKVQTTPEGQANMSLIIAVATLAGLSPEDVVNQMNKHERIEWFMSEMANIQVKKTIKRLDEVGDLGFGDEVEKLKKELTERLKEANENSSITKSK